MLLEPRDSLVVTQFRPQIQCQCAESLCPVLVSGLVGELGGQLQQPGVVSHHQCRVGPALVVLGELPVEQRPLLLPGVQREVDTFTQAGEPVHRQMLKVFFGAL